MKGIISLVLGFLLMIPLGLIFDAMNWSTFHGWGLVHGSFLLAWPMLTIACYAVIRWVIAPILATSDEPPGSSICGQCKAPVTNDAEVCPACGFVFGGSGAPG